MHVVCTALCCCFVVVVAAAAAAAAADVVLIIVPPLPFVSAILVIDDILVLWFRNKWK